MHFYKIFIELKIIVVIQYNNGLSAVVGFYKKAQLFIYVFVTMQLGKTCTECGSKGK
jgi:hypothetical protein